MPGDNLKALAAEDQFTGKFATGGPDSATALC